jgi:hypothetical protein
MTSGVLSFTKASKTSNEFIVCTGNICKNIVTINRGDIYWKSGHESSTRPRSAGAKRQPMRLCQKCFGFWLARYWFFDYNPFQIDKNDIAWQEYWDRDWEAGCMKAFFEDLEIGKKVLLETNEPN